MYFPLLFIRIMTTGSLESQAYKADPDSMAVKVSEDLMEILVPLASLANLVLCASCMDIQDLLDFLETVAGRE